MRAFDETEEQPNDPREDTREQAAERGETTEQPERLAQETAEQPGVPQHETAEQTAQPRGETAEQPWERATATQDAEPRPGKAAPGPDVLAAGTEVGPYRVEGELGRGVSGVVYRAFDPAAGRAVALKLLRGGGSAVRSERFRREGELAATLDHPGIVRIHSAGAHAGRPYLAYALVDGGRTLDRVLPELPLHRRVALVAQVARALGHAHRRGVVHRDLKSANVLVDREGRARVTDFGLGRAAGPSELTRDGAAMGTPVAMPPEQLAGNRWDEVGPPADTWALGVLLYQALVGRLPFDGTTLAELSARIWRVDYQPPRQVSREVPAVLDAVCRRALQREPADRYPDGDAVAAALEDWLHQRPGQSRGAWAVIALAAAALALALLALITFRPGEDQARPMPSPPLRLELDPLPAQVLQPRLRLQGRVNAGRARLHVAGASAEVTGEADRQGRFALALKLRSGPNRLVLRAEAPERAPAEWTVRVRCLDVPAWLRERPPDERPPLPLPAGLRALPEPGVFRNQRDGSELAYVPPGRFRMGSPAASGRLGEAPAHEVHITRGFFLGRHEVTWAQFRAFSLIAGREPPDATEPSPQHPVVGVSWEEAQAYCAWAGGRLPYEAEWELAARGPRGFPYPWGNAEAHAERCNYGDLHGGTLPVGSLPLGASPFGCLDMAGNVWEWVHDWLAPYADGPQIDPRGPAQGMTRVIRGGAYNNQDPGARLRSTARYSRRPELGQPNLGFRLLVPVAPQ